MAHLRLHNDVVERERQRESKHTCAHYRGGGDGDRETGSWERERERESEYECRPGVCFYLGGQR